MPAYLIGRVEITDRERYAEYMKVTPAVIERFGGRFIVRGGDVVTLEGPPETHRIVVIEFPTLDQAKAFYNSDQYLEAKKLRQGAATAQFIAMDGCAPPKGNKAPLLLLGLIGVLALGLVLLAFQPTATVGKFPNQFSAAERSEIASLIRHDGYRRAVRAAARGQFKPAWRLICNTRQQSVWRVGNQPDGAIAVHVGIEDKTQTDGYRLCSRYILVKEKGHWKLEGADL